MKSGREDTCMVLVDDKDCIPDGNDQDVETGVGCGRGFHLNQSNSIMTTRRGKKKVGKQWGL